MLSHDALRTYLLQTPNRRLSGNEADRVNAYKKRMNDALTHNRVIEEARVVDEMLTSFTQLFRRCLGSSTESGWLTLRSIYTRVCF